MKKTFILLMISILTIFQTSCEKETAVPLENPQPELFEVVYATNFYSILKRIDIDQEAIYYSIAYIVGHQDDTCIVGAYHNANYIVYDYKEYYQFVEANKLNLYTCSVLIEQGIIGSE